VLMPHRRPGAGRTGHGVRVLVLAAALLVVAVAAPAASAWQGNLIVRKVNVGGPASDTFAFTLTKDPNQYVDVWNPAAQTFTLTGAPGPGGPFTEGSTQKTFANLWAGYDVPEFQNWVTYTITEAAKHGYTTSAACTIDGAGLWTTGNSTTATYGPWTWTQSTTPGGDTAVSTSVRWLNNITYTTTCTFTNTYRGTITLVKHFTGPFSSTDRATLAIDDTVKPGVGDGGSIGPIEVPGNTQHAISESGVDQSLYETTFDDCGLSGANAPTGSGLTRTLTVPAGQDVVCNVTNRRRSGQITLRKSLTPAGAGQFNLTLDGTPVAVAGSNGNTAFGNGDQSAPSVVASGSHVIAERTATAGQSLSDYTASVACVNRAAGGAAVPVQSDGTVAMGDGADLLCTFTNAKKAGGGVSPGGGAGGGGSSTSQGGSTPGRSAHVVGPSSCLSRARVTVGVRGHGIKSVSFRLAGKHVKTVSTRDKNGVYALVVRTGSLPHGATLVVASVTFRSGGGHRTLRLRLSRCATRSVTPKFTG